MQFCNCHPQQRVSKKIRPQYQHYRRSNKGVNSEQLKDFLDHKAATYEQPQFLEQDPIQIPHLFQKKKDIEISGFFGIFYRLG